MLDYGVKNKAGMGDYPRWIANEAIKGALHSKYVSNSSWRNTAVFQLEQVFLDLDQLLQSESILT